jgi:hypothetical protein
VCVCVCVRVFARILGIHTPLLDLPPLKPQKGEVELSIYPPFSPLSIYFLPREKLLKRKVPMNFAHGDGGQFRS